MNATALPHSRSVTGRVVAITLFAALTAFLLAPQAPVGRQLWPLTVALDAAPSEAQMGLFVLLGVMSALAFGAAIAFLVYGRAPLQRRLAGEARSANVVNAVVFAPNQCGNSSMAGT